MELSGEQLSLVGIVQEAIVGNCMGGNYLGGIVF